MRVQIASDLHLEYLESRFPDYRGVEPCDADVLVLAGDISKGTRALDLFANWPYPVIYVPGNHEFYEASVQIVNAEFVARAADFPNIHVLNPGCIVMNGVRFIGCTLWTDYEIFGAENRVAAMQKSEQVIPDHTTIKADDGGAFTAETVRSLHLAQRTWLRNALAAPFNGRTVAITHFAPHAQSIHDRFSGDLTSAAFVSDLSPELSLSEIHIHGHMHDSFDYAVKRTRVIANPLGYCKGVRVVRHPDELRRENTLFNPRLVISVL